MRLLLAPVLVALALPLLASAASLININTADSALLQTLPGIGPTYAGRIIDYRTAHGLFATTEDIEQVSGIGPSTYAKIAPLITVGDVADTSTPSATASSSRTRTASARWSSAAYSCS